MNHEDVKKIDALFRQAAQGGMSRRQLMARGAALGISPFLLSVAFVQKSHEAIAQGAENPLGVDPAAPLDVVIFKGGYGDSYAINVNDTLYSKLYPDAQITYTGTQRLQEQYQARFVDGNPPDVMDNSGAGNFNNATLVSEGQLADLQPLMDAPSYDTEGVLFKDTLLPSTQGTGVYDGKQMVLNFVYSIQAIWYNQALFDEKGWTYPTTWDDMLAMCKEIKDAGMNPWTYAGQYPQYVRAPFEQMVWKHGGWDAILKLDNLAEDAWTQQPVMDALAAWQQLPENDYILPGTEALSHTESQAAWLKGDAVFLPCGSWLANESKADTPEGFLMTAKATPSLADDMFPQTGITAGAGEGFIVPAQGKNVKGGMEWLRLLFSVEGAEFFAENVQSLTVVKGAGEGKDFGTAFNSALAAINDAGSDLFSGCRYAGWYTPLKEESEYQFGLLMTGGATAEDVSSAMQDAVNSTRDDDSIKKYTREKDEIIVGEGGGTATPSASPASPAATPAG